MLDLLNVFNTGDYKYSFIVVDKFGGYVNDIADNILSVDLTETRKGQSAILDFQFLVNNNKKEQVLFNTGSAVSFSVNGIFLFRGFIFEISRTKEGIATGMAYDCMRYLKNPVYVFEKTGEPASTLIQKAVEQCGLKISSTILSSINYKWEKMPFIQYQKTAIDLINWVLGRWISKRTYQGQKIKTLILRADPEEASGKTVKLAFAEDNPKSNIIIGNDSLLTDFTISENIDEKTYTSVRLLYDAGLDDGRKEAATMSIKEAKLRYGTLVLQKDFMDADTAQLLQAEKAREAGQDPAKQSASVDWAKIQLNAKQMAMGMVKFYAKPTFHLSFQSLGILGLRAGDYIPINIDGLAIGTLMTDSEYKHIIIDDIRHHFSEGVHTMMVNSSVAIVDRVNTTLVPTPDD